MKRLSLTLLLMLLLLTGCTGKTAAPVEHEIHYPELAFSAVQTLTDGNYQDFYAMFDETLKKEIPALDIQNQWNRMYFRYGAFQYYQSDFAITGKDDLQTASIPCVFEHGSVVVRISFNQNGEICGYYLTEDADSNGSPRLDNDTDVFIGSDDYRLVGSLTLPEGSGPFPAVILLQDEGYDRNNQIGPNVPFLDMAEQLSAQGVAVLRYDSRSYLYDEELAKLEDSTVQNEIIDDVVTAVAYLQSRPDICPDRIFLAGHHFAGYLIPRIAEQTPEAAGYMILAASPRPTEDLMLESGSYALDCESILDDTAREALKNTLKQQQDNIKNLTPDSTRKPDELFGKPASLWLDLKDYNPLTDVNLIQKPVLVLQGGRDYEVPKDDFYLWQEDLQYNSHATLRYFDNLNHLFMSGIGKSTPAEYQQKGTVHPEVTDAMANFVKNH